MVELLWIEAPLVGDSVMPKLSFPSRVFEQRQYVPFGPTASVLLTQGNSASIKRHFCVAKAERKA